MTRYRGALLSRAGDNLPRSRSTHTPVAVWHRRSPNDWGSSSTFNTPAATRSLALLTGVTFYVCVCCNCDSLLLNRCSGHWRRLERRQLLF